MCVCVCVCVCVYLLVQVGVAQEGGGDNVIKFQTCRGSSATLTDTSHLVDGHSYVVLLKVKGLLMMMIITERQTDRGSHTD